jgi:hypothetical protein
MAAAGVGVLREPPYGAVPVATLDRGLGGSGFDGGTGVPTTFGDDGSRNWIWFAAAAVGMLAVAFIVGGIAVGAFGLGSGGGNGGGSATTLKVFPSSIQLPVGTTAQLSTNAPFTLLNQVQWVALQPTIASVTTSGTVGTLSPGVATIVARYAFDTTQFATSTITVLGPSIPTTTGTTAVVRP